MASEIGFKTNWEEMRDLVSLSLVTCLQMKLTIYQRNIHYGQSDD
jgi:hypothetical protein